jgi:hypothetical protein
MTTNRKYNMTDDHARQIITQAASNYSSCGTDIEKSRHFTTLGVAYECLF